MSSLSYRGLSINPPALREEPHFNCVDERKYAIGGENHVKKIVLLFALEGWLPENSFLYFEGGCLDEELEEFMRQY